MTQNMGFNAGTGKFDIDDSNGASVSAKDLVPITPHDSADQGGPFRGLLYGGDGTLVVVMANGQERPLPSGLLAKNVIHPMAFTRIKAASTATQIYGAL